MADIYEQLAVRIIAEQEKVIGPIASDQAKQITGVTLDWSNHKVFIEGDKKQALAELVEKYKELFGKVAVEVCKEAIKGFEITKEDLPTELQ